LITVPCLTVLSTFCGVFAGYVFLSSSIDMSLRVYFHEVVESIQLRDVWLTLIKSAIFATNHCVPIQQREEAGDRPGDRRAGHYRSARHRHGARARTRGSIAQRSVRPSFFDPSECAQGACQRAADGDANFNYPPLTTATALVDWRRIPRKLMMQERTRSGAAPRHQPCPRM